MTPEQLDAILAAFYGRPLTEKDNARKWAQEARESVARWIAAIEDAGFEIVVKEQAP